MAPYMRLTDKMPLELTPSHDRLNNVRLFFDFPAVVAGDFTSKKQYHHLYRQSDVTYWRILDDWDEFLFDKEERLLRGVCLNIPEFQLPATQIPNFWADTPLQTGGLRLLETTDLWLDLTDCGWVSENGQTLVCAYASRLKGENYFRVSIADDLQLLFADEQYCGWMLHQPSQYLIHSWQPITKAEPDQELSFLFAEWMKRRTEETFERMEDEEPTLLAELSHLYHKIDLNRGAKEQRKSLRWWIQYTAEAFYDESMFWHFFKAGLT